MDGQHRWEIAKEEGARSIPAFRVDGLSDADAKRVTVILNDLHGQARPDLLSALVRDLASTLDLDELLVGFPYSAETLSSLAGIELPSLPERPLPAEPSPGAQRWVERTFRLPPDVALVLDEAIEKAKDGEPVENWQALERISAEFLAS